MSGCFTYNTFSQVKKVLSVGKAKLSKGCKIMAITGAGGVVLPIRIEFKKPHEVTLVEKTLDDCFVEDLPERLIGDRGYSTDPQDKKAFSLLLRTEQAKKRKQRRMVVN